MCYEIQVASQSPNSYGVFYSLRGILRDVLWRPLPPASASPRPAPQVTGFPAKSDVARGGEGTGRGREPRRQKQNLKHLGEGESEPCLGTRATAETWWLETHSAPFTEQGRGRDPVARATPLSVWNREPTHTPSVSRPFSLLSSPSGTYRPALRYHTFVCGGQLHHPHLEQKPPWEQVANFWWGYRGGGRFNNIKKKKKQKKQSPGSPSSWWKPLFLLIPTPAPCPII